MARSARPLTGTLWPGLAIAAFILVIGAAVLMALLGQGIGTRVSIWQDEHLWKVTRFTFLQASLSVLLSIILALPVARALARRQGMPGRRLILTVSAIAMVVPTTVAALGLLAVWGRHGWIAPAASALGLAPRTLEIYGLPGILLGHVFFNAPLMMRIFLTGLEGIPEQHWRLAAQFGMRSTDIFRLIEWPVLRTILPGAAGLVFLLCFTSFAMVLMLGGGPAASTLEVSIYAAVRFDFDLGLAARLSLWQMAICLFVLLALSAGRTEWPRTEGNPIPALRLDAASLGSKVSDSLALVIYLALIALPLLIVLLRGVNPALLDLWWQASFIRALLSSLSIALASALLTLLIAWLIAEARRTLMVESRLGGAGPARWSAAVIDGITTLYLALPAIVFGTGAFLLLRGLADPFLMAPFLVIAANVLLALPFALRVLQGRLAQLARNHDLLCASLGINRWNRLRLVELPAMRRELGFAGGLAAALSMGDLGVIALFGSNQFQTLPWLLYQTMNRYRADEAAAMALVLLLLGIGLFAAFDLLSRERRC